MLKISSNMIFFIFFWGNANIVPARFSKSRFFSCLNLVRPDTGIWCACIGLGYYFAILEGFQVMLRLRCLEMHSPRMQVRAWTMDKTEVEVWEEANKLIIILNLKQ